MIEGLPKDYSLFLSHIHTTASDGMEPNNEIFASIAAFRDIHQVNIIAAITDHDTLRGILSAERAANAYGVPLVVGQEITVGKNKFKPKHLLAYWETEPEIAIPYNRCAEGTIDKIRESNGIAIPAHTNAFWGLGSFTTREVIAFQNRELISGFESINGNTNRINELRPLLRLLRNGQPALFGGSDGHHGKRDIFRAATAFKGNTVRDLFVSIEEGTTKPLLIRGTEGKITFQEKVEQNIKSNIYLNLDRYLWHTLQPAQQDLPKAA